MLQERAFPLRRLNSRVETLEGVWVLWSCDRCNEISQVRDLSLGGLFVETASSRAVGAMTALDFLGQEKSDQGRSRSAAPKSRSWRGPPVHNHEGWRSFTSSRLVEPVGPFVLPRNFDVLGRGSFDKASGSRDLPNACLVGILEAL